MAGAIILIAVLLIFPVLVIMTGAAASLILGEGLYRDGRARNEGSELLDIPD